MKHFHISAEFDLTRKPVWLEDFRDKYDSSYAYHVTLKNPTEIKEEDVEKLHEELAELIEKCKLKGRGLEIDFEKLMFGGTSKGRAIMIRAEKDERLFEFQESLSRKLGQFGKNTNDDHTRFEKNFEPHITIGRHLNEQQFEEAKKDLGKDTKITGNLARITLTVVDEPIEKNWINLDNKTYFTIN